jgi:tetratricopeptide (TPR) repeat protein
MQRFALVVIALLIAIPPCSAAPARPATSTPAPGVPPGAAYPSADALEHYVKARLLEERGDDMEALAEYLRALSTDPRSLSATRRISELAARRGEASSSLEYADRALAIAPGDARSLWLKGSALFNLGQSTQALEALEAATRADSEQVEYWMTLARAAESMDHIPVVARAYRHVVWINEDDAEAWFQLAAAEARLGHYDLADSALARSTALNPMRPGQVFLEGWIRESTGRRAEAIALYRHHLELHPDDQATRARLVDLLEREGRLAEAYDEARRVTRARPADLDALQIEADLAFRLHRDREGTAALERLRRVAPNDPATVARALSVLGSNGRGHDAVAQAESWARAHAGDYRGDMLIAQAAAADRQLAVAIEHARRAVTGAPDSLGPRVLLGRLYQSEKRFAEAEPVWAEAVGRFPGVAGLGLDLAFCREQLGDLDGSESAVRDVLKREPGNPSALNFLGYLLADHNRKLEEAEALIQRAVDAEPDNGAFLDSLGWVYYRLGRFQEARAKLERAVQLTPDAVVLEHLGDVYKDLKLFELARDQYARALDRDSSNTRLRTKLAGLP